MSILGGHTIVFLPGLDGTGISFEPLQRVLPKDVDSKVVRYPPDRLLSFEDTVEQAWEQAHTAQGDILVLAESFSGPVAVELVGSGRLKAKALILSSTFARWPRPRFLKILSHAPLEAMMRIPWPKSLLQTVIEGGAETADLFLDMWKRVRMLVPAKVLAHRIKMLRRMDVRHWLAKTTVPCLYLQASRDRTVPPSALFDFVERVPDLRIRRIKGPHFILQAQPRACLVAILDFMRLAETGSDEGAPRTRP